MGSGQAVALSMRIRLVETGKEEAMMTAEAVMSGNYAILTDRNKATADSFIDFLAARQEKHEKELLDTVQECEKGNYVGPFHSVEELMADLYA